jgi:hypothetical protein
MKRSILARLSRVCFTSLRTLLVGALLLAPQLAVADGLGPGGYRLMMGLFVLVAIGVLMLVVGGIALVAVILVK